MDDPFEIPVLLNGEEVLFPARLVQQGYTHRFVVTVNEQEIIFEPDEEQTYRALLLPEQLDSHKPVKADVLQAISAGIEAILK